MRCAILLCLLLAGCGRLPPMPVIGEVPEFRLTNQQGQPFGRDALLGKIWIADFVFTHCEGPCPRMSSHMRTLQDKTDADVQLVSFTVDPARDTPEVLAAYGKKFGADPKRWNFLTGSVPDLNALERDAFKLATVGGTEIDHSTRFVLMDRHSRIRGYYGLSEDSIVDRLARDLARLKKETE